MFFLVFFVFLLFSVLFLFSVVFVAFSLSVVFQGGGGVLFGSFTSWFGYVSAMFAYLFSYLFIFAVAAIGREK